VQDGHPCDSSSGGRRFVGAVIRRIGGDESAAFHADASPVTHVGKTAALESLDRHLKPVRN
jgi:hypothetical protein